jgi:uncharacterized protein YceK
MKRLALSLIVLVSLSGCELVYFGLLVEREPSSEQFLNWTDTNPTITRKVKNGQVTGG